MSFNLKDRDMANETDSIQVDEYRDDILRAAKDPGQARCRAQMRSGERTQESMILISRETVKKMTVRHRSDGS